VANEKKTEAFLNSDKKLEANWGGWKLVGCQEKCCFTSNSRWKNFVGMILNYFSRIAELGVEEKISNLQNRPTFQDQSVSPSSSLEFYKSCKSELASKFIPRDIICGRSLAESKICLKTEKILAR
jgi:hypothetical protein